MDTKQSENDFCNQQKTKQPASNTQSVQVLCCLLLISNSELEMKPLKLELNNKGI